MSTLVRVRTGVALCLLAAHALLCTALLVLGVAVLAEVGWGVVELAPPLAVGFVSIVAIVATAVTAIVGLARGATWGRWAALGVALFYLFPADTPPRTRDEWLVAGVYLLPGLVLVACLAGRQMAARFEGDHFGGSAEVGRARVSRVLPWVLGLNLAGTQTAICAIAGFLDEGGAGVALAVLTLAAFGAVVAGVILLGRRATAGLLLLCVADLVLVALHVATVPDPLGPISLPLAVTAVSTLVATAALARPMAAILGGANVRGAGPA